MKIQPSEWERIIANEATDKELISKIYKQLLSQVNTQRNKKTSVPTKTCTQIFIPKLFTTAKKWKPPKYPSI